MSKLTNKTLFVSGASRGIGLAIAKKAAQDGANVILAAKTAEPHPNFQEQFIQPLKKLKKLEERLFPSYVMSGLKINWRKL